MTDIFSEDATEIFCFSCGMMLSMSTENIVKMTQGMSTRQLDGSLTILDLSCIQFDTADAFSVQYIYY